MTPNTKNGNADAEQIVSIVRDQHVEVLAMQEVSGSLIERLSAAGLDELLPRASSVWQERATTAASIVIYTLAPMRNASKASCPSLDLLAPASHDNRRIPRGAPRQRIPHRLKTGTHRLALEREPHQLWGTFAPIQR